MAMSIESAFDGAGERGAEQAFIPPPIGDASLKERLSQVVWENARAAGVRRWQVETGALREHPLDVYLRLFSGKLGVDAAQLSGGMKQEIAQLRVGDIQTAVLATLLFGERQIYVRTNALLVNIRLAVDGVPPELCSFAGKEFERAFYTGMGDACLGARDVEGAVHFYRMANAFEREDVKAGLKAYTAQGAEQRDHVLRALV